MHMLKRTERKSVLSLDFTLTVAIINVTLSGIFETESNVCILFAPSNVCEFLCNVIKQV